MCYNSCRWFNAYSEACSKPRSEECPTEEDEERYLSKSEEDKEYWALLKLDEERDLGG